MCLVAFIEACREARGSNQEWFYNVSAAAAPLLHGRRPRGTGGYSYQILGDRSIALLELIQARGSELAAHPTYGKAAFLECINASPMRSVFSAADPNVIVLSRLGAALDVELQDRLPPGAGDSVGLIGGAFRGEGVNLCWLLAEPLRPSPRQLRHLSGLAEHLSAGYRVRQLLGSTTRAYERAAAVFTPDGRVQHASADLPRDQHAALIERLVAAVRGSERLRTRSSQRSVADAEALFGAFVSGQYALIDQIDADGKRWVVAMRVKDPRGSGGLTVRERRVAIAAASGLANKAIAAEIGISTRAVAYDLRSCLAKLGLGDRHALVQWFAARANL
jgi:DNA-binding NarL/FixJ family response regulator